LKAAACQYCEAAWICSTRQRSGLSGDLAGPLIRSALIVQLCDAAQKIVFRRAIRVRELRASRLPSSGMIRNQAPERPQPRPEPPPTPGPEQPPRPGPDIIPPTPGPDIQPPIGPDTTTPGPGPDIPPVAPPGPRDMPPPVARQAASRPGS
jgi:hypothetical protein